MNRLFQLKPQILGKKKLGISLALSTKSSL